MPALFETAVRLVIWGLECRVLMRVSGTPQRPKPPARTVLFDWSKERAEEAEGRTLLISLQVEVEENARVAE